MGTLTLLAPSLASLLTAKLSSTEQEWRARTTGSPMMRRCRWRVWPRQFQTLPSSLVTLMTTLGLCQDHLALQSSLLGWTTTGLNFTTWIPVAHTFSLTPRRLALEVREPNRVCKSITLKEATKSAFTILKQVMEEKLNETNVEAAT